MWLRGWVILLGFGFGTMVQGAEWEEAWKLIRQESNEGHYAEVVQRGNALFLGEGEESTANPIFDKPLDWQEVRECLSIFMNALHQLQRLEEQDVFLEKIVRTYPQHWRMLQQVAKCYGYDLQKTGYIVGGKFYRGRHRQGGTLASCAERDRIRALQILQQCIPLVQKDSDTFQAGWFFINLAQTLLQMRQHNTGSWELQALSDTTQLPDWDTENPYGRPYHPQGAPVDESGKVVFFEVPQSWETATCDGERWRWALEQAVVCNRGKHLENFDLEKAFRQEVDFQIATFLHRQWGVQTLAAWGFRWNEENTEEGEGSKRQTALSTLETLSDSETVARLATGIQRFEIPEAWNYIAILQKLSQMPGHRQRIALWALGSIFQNRRQWTRSAECWKTLMEMEESDKTPSNFLKNSVDFWSPFGSQAEKCYRQVTGNWGRFEPQSQQTLANPQVRFRYRNARKVRFQARQVDLQQLYAQMRENLQNAAKNSPFLAKDSQRYFQEDIQFADNLAWRLVQEKGEKWLSEEKITWDCEWTPAEGHRDCVVSVKLPVEQPGAYLVEASVEDGNRSAMLVWVTDTVLVRKTLDEAILYYVADAVTGKEIPDAKITALGFRQEWINQGGNRRQPRIRVECRETTGQTDERGIWIATQEELNEEYRWFLTVQRPGKETFSAFLGFYQNNIHYPRWEREQYDRERSFPMTDRPVYRPGQTVSFQFWTARAKYDVSAPPSTTDDGTRPILLPGEVSRKIEVWDPRGEKIFEKTYLSDEWGAISGEIPLSAKATLGQYRILLDAERDRGQVTFRVEEYKKPEFEVTVEAPTEPVLLGEKIRATIHAKYYFGAPVTQGTVKYKVTRTAYSQRWYAPGRWDWLYGRGYGWCGCDYTWFPGWGVWGTLAPVPQWLRGERYEQPEVVLEQEVALTEAMAGKVEVEFETFAAKSLHPDQDHQYTIQAEVVDASRRRIDGRGQVLVARKPFQVHSWLDRGYGQVGEPMTAYFAARTLDGKPVTGKGEVCVYEISYDAEGVPQEKLLQKSEMTTTPDGEVAYPLKATHAGQFRVAFVLTDERKHTQEGGIVFTICGDGFDGKDLRFNDLELVTDKSEYRPGETLRLLVNTDRADATVVLFVRCTNGVCSAPQILRMNGKSQVVEIPLRAEDQPNIFIEAMTVANAQVYTQVREIYLPPEENILNMEILPEKTELLPGETLRAKIRLSLPGGEPFVGDTVVTVYDKSLEYISGGSNIPDIYPFFWGWKRAHHPQTILNTQLRSWNLVPPKEESMTTLGLFGEISVMGRSLNRSSRFKRSTSKMERASEDSIMLNEAMPMAAAAPMAEEAAPMEENTAEMFADTSQVDGGTLREEEGLHSGGGAQAVEVTVRTNFADTAFWKTSLRTDENGEAEITFPMPENLTTWKVCAWGMGKNARVGKAQAELITRKNLILRMQVPRFMTTSDEIVLSANVHNYLTTEKEVTLSIALPDDSPIVLLKEATRKVRIPANGEVRADWRVRAEKEGESSVEMVARTDEESDAMRLAFPVQIHGMVKQVAQSGMISADDAEGVGRMTFTIPEARRADETRLEIRFSPTLAGAILDAIPYLADYPYGCTEQTLNRFLPSVLAQKALSRLGVSLETIRNRQNNLNAQELGDAKERARQWEKQRSRERQEISPVFDDAKLSEMVEDGVARLANMQCSDGGWGWFSGWGEYSSPYLTAYVTRGLLLAQQNEVSVPQNVLDGGVRWLRDYQQRQCQLLQEGSKKEPKIPFKLRADNTDAMVFFALAQGGVQSESSRKMSQYLYRDRIQLSHQANALLGIAWFQREEKEKVAEVLKYLSQFLRLDDENQTAWLQLPEGNCWWHWYGNEIETQAMYLRLLCLSGNGEYTLGIPGKKPSDVAPWLVKYLLNHRKNATYWNSTRDTALVLEAMTHYLQTTREWQPQMTVEVWLDGVLKKTVDVTPENLFTLDNTFVLTGKEVSSGEHTVELRRKGAGPLYFNGYATYFTLEDFIRKAGLEVKVERKYYRLQRRENATVRRAGSRGQVVEENVEKYDRIELPSGAEVQSGDLIEVELLLESKNDYTFLLIEDKKPAGFEPLEVRSGYDGNSLGAYVEYRDDRVVFFTRELRRGIHSVSYRLRAEMPGNGSALPTRVEAMYAPELRANSDEIKIRCVD
ncbi:MAG: alpha-2-macroglobulin family protein [Planctomycetia bacterium]|nr:alpha-2-macroglobulin family protein [Planctomycetia bacterium]